MLSSLFVAVNELKSLTSDTAFPDVVCRFKKGAAILGKGRAEIRFQPLISSAVISESEIEAGVLYVIDVISRI